MPREKLTTKLDLRLPKTLAEAAKAKADVENRPLSQVVRELLQAWVAEPAPTAK